MNQPAYWQLEQKISARIENVSLYRKLTGNYSIPENREYWTLCNLQPSGKDGTEIDQMESVGLIKKTQFHGVDRDCEIIDQNRNWHPEANWHNGEWLDVIRTQKRFNPALVYFDSTSFADHLNTTKMIASTMYLCPGNTVLLANVMLNDPRSSVRFDSTALVKQLPHYISPFELRKWRSQVENFMYDATSKTNMITYAFYKEENE